MRPARESDHQIFSIENTLIGFDSKMIGFADIINRAICPNFDFRFCTFRQKHLDDQPGTIAAKKLTESFFVEFDAMFFY